MINKTSNTNNNKKINNLDLTVKDKLKKLSTKKNYKRSRKKLML